MNEAKMSFLLNFVPVELPLALLCAPLEHLPPRLHLLPLALWEVFADEPLPELARVLQQVRVVLLNLKQIMWQWQSVNNVHQTYCKSETLNP